MFDVLMESNPNVQIQKKIFSLIASTVLHSVVLAVAIIAPLLFHGNLESGKVRYLSCSSATPSSPATPAASGLSQSDPVGQSDTHSERKDHGSRIHPAGDCHGCR